MKRQGSRTPSGPAPGIGGASGDRGRALVLLVLAPALVGMDVLSSPNPLVEAGNGHMASGKPDEALQKYDEALVKGPAQPGVYFNRGAALYGLSRFDEATESFLRATEAKDTKLKASAFYNLGNSFFQANKFGEAAEAFKRSLHYDPRNQRAKWNLELALRKKQEQEKNDQGKNDDQDKNQKDDKNQGQEPKDQEKQEDQEKDPQAEESDKPGEEKGDQKDQQGEDQQKEQEQAQKDQPEKPQPPQDQQKKKPEPADQGGNQAPQRANKDDKSPPQPAPDMRQIDAILDSLEQSPRNLEQELARIRALGRKPPAKDW